MKSFLNERIVKSFENFQFLVAVGIAVCSKDATKRSFDCGWKTCKRSLFLLNVILQKPIIYKKLIK